MADKTIGAYIHGWFSSVLPLSAAEATHSPNSQVNDSLYLQQTGKAVKGYIDSYHQFQSIWSTRFSPAENTSTHEVVASFLAEQTIADKQYLLVKNIQGESLFESQNIAETMLLSSLMNAPGNSEKNKQVFERLFNSLAVFITTDNVFGEELDSRSYQPRGEASLLTEMILAVSLIQASNLMSDGGVWKGEIDSKDEAQKTRYKAEAQKILDKIWHKYFKDKPEGHLLLPALSNSLFPDKQLIATENVNPFFYQIFANADSNSEHNWSKAKKDTYSLLKSTGQTVFPDQLIYDPKFKKVVPYTPPEETVLQWVGYSDPTPPLANTQLSLLTQRSSHALTYLNLGVAMDALKFNESEAQLLAAKWSAPITDALKPEQTGYFNHDFPKNPPTTSFQSLSSYFLLAKAGKSVPLTSSLLSELEKITKNEYFLQYAAANRDVSKANFEEQSRGLLNLSGFSGGWAVGSVLNTTVEASNLQGLTQPVVLPAVSSRVKVSAFRRYLAWPFATELGFQEPYIKFSEILNTISDNKSANRVATIREIDSFILFPLLKIKIAAETGSSGSEPFRLPNTDVAELRKAIIASVLSKQCDKNQLVQLLVLLVENDKLFLSEIELKQFFGKLLETGFENIDQQKIQQLSAKLEISEADASTIISIYKDIYANYNKNELLRQYYQVPDVFKLKGNEQYLEPWLRYEWQNTFSISNKIAERRSALLEMSKIADDWSKLPVPSSDEYNAITEYRTLEIRLNLKMSQLATSLGDFNQAKMYLDKSDLLLSSLLKSGEIIVKDYKQGMDLKTEFNMSWFYLGQLQTLMGNMSYFDERYQYFAKDLTTITHPRADLIRGMYLDHLPGQTNEMLITAANSKLSADQYTASESLNEEVLTHNPRAIYVLNYWYKNDYPPIADALANLADLSLQFIEGSSLGLYLRGLLVKLQIEGGRSTYRNLDEFYSKVGQSLSATGASNLPSPNVLSSDVETLLKHPKLTLRLMGVEDQGELIFRRAELSRNYRKYSEAKSAYLSLVAPGKNVAIDNVERLIADSLVISDTSSFKQEVYPGSLSPIEIDPDQKALEQKLLVMQTWLSLTEIYQEEGNCDLAEKIFNALKPTRDAMVIPEKYYVLHNNLLRMEESISAGLRFNHVIQGQFKAAKAVASDFKPVSESDHLFQNNIDFNADMSNVWMLRMHGEYNKTQLLLDKIETKYLSPALDPFVYSSRYLRIALEKAALQSELYGIENAMGDYLDILKHLKAQIHKPETLNNAYEGYMYYLILANARLSGVKIPAELQSDIKKIPEEIKKYEKYIATFADAGGDAFREELSRLTIPLRLMQADLLMGVESFPAAEKLLNELEAEIGCLSCKGSCQLINRDLEWDIRLHKARLQQNWLANGVVASDTVRDHLATGLKNAWSLTSELEVSKYDKSGKESKEWKNLSPIHKVRFEKKYIEARFLEVQLFAESRKLGISPTEITGKLGRYAQARAKYLDSLNVNNIQDVHQNLTKLAKNTSFSPEDQKLIMRKADIAHAELYQTLGDPQKAIDTIQNIDLANLKSSSLRLRAIQTVINASLAQGRPESIETALGILNGLVKPEDLAKAWKPISAWLTTHGWTKDITELKPIFTGRRNKKAQEWLNSINAAELNKEDGILYSPVTQKHLWRGFENGFARLPIGVLSEWLKPLGNNYDQQETAFMELQREIASILGHAVDPKKLKGDENVRLARMTEELMLISGKTRIPVTEKPKALARIWTQFAELKVIRPDYAINFMLNYASANLAVNNYDRALAFVDYFLKPKPITDISDLHLQQAVQILKDKKVPLGISSEKRIEFLMLKKAILDAGLKDSSAILDVTAQISASSLDPNSTLGQANQKSAEYEADLAKAENINTLTFASDKEINQMIDTLVEMMLKPKPLRGATNAQKMYRFLIALLAKMEMHEAEDALIFTAKELSTLTLGADEKQKIQRFWSENTSVKIGQQDFTKTQLAEIVRTLGVHENLKFVAGL